MQVVASAHYRPHRDRVLTRRNGSVDYLRLVAAAGVVVFHLGGEAGAIGYAGLPVLAALLGMFAVGRLQTPQGRRGLGLQARHLVLVWLAWSVVYGAMKLADMVASGSGFSDEFQPYMLATGPAIHLWFLPFAALVLLLMRLFWKWLTPAGLSGYAAIVAATGIAALASLWLTVVPDLPKPLPQWATVFPAVGFGLLLGLAKTRTGWLAIWGIGLALVMTAAAVAGLLMQVWLLAAALAAVIAALALPLPQSPGSDMARKLSMTIYLLHPLVVALVLRLSDWPRETLATLVVVLAASAICGWALSRSPLGRWTT